MRLEVKDLACGYGQKTVVNGVHLTLESGEVLCVLGPNGIGKTTFFKTLLGLLKLKGGEILLNGENTLNWSKKRLARAIAYVPQAHTPPFPYKVLDVVVMGRTAHMGIFSTPTREDAEIAEDSLRSLNIYHLKDRVYTEISGGERQLVLIARALTQQPEILAMDEPTSNLDLGNQVRVLRQIKKLAERGLGIIMTSHFPDHAFLCSTRVALLKQNNVILTGSVDQIITEENMFSAYGVRVKIATVDNDLGEPVKTCIPMLN